LNPRQSRKENAMQQDLRMDELEVHDYARALFDAHGNKARAEAAQRARKLAAEGKSRQAEAWRRIEAAIQSMDGPHQG
jgi:hypothetical protein